MPKVATKPKGSKATAKPKAVVVPLAIPPVVTIEERTKRYRDACRDYIRHGGFARLSIRSICEAELVHDIIATGQRTATVNGRVYEVMRDGRLIVTACEVHSGPSRVATSETVYGYPLPHGDASCREILDSLLIVLTDLRESQKTRPLRINYDTTSAHRAALGSWLLSRRSTNAALTKLRSRLVLAMKATGLNRIDDFRLGGRAGGCLVIPRELMPAFKKGAVNV